MIRKESIEQIVEKLLEGTDKFVVDILVQPSNKVFVYIDGDRNITIGDCQELSRSIENVLDRDQEDYNLTVSSFGIDRPMKLLRQYRKNIGKEMDVTTQSGRNLRGILVKVFENEIEPGNEKEIGKEIEIELEHPFKKKEEKKENTILPYSEIKTAKLIVKFRK